MVRRARLSPIQHSASCPLPTPSQQNQKGGWMSGLSMPDPFSLAAVWHDLPFTEAKTVQNWLTELTDGAYAPGAYLRLNMCDVAKDFPRLPQVLN